MADLIDYIFRFPDFGTALRDTTVGPFFTTPPLPGFLPKEAIVFPNRVVDSVTPASGYWCIITTLGTVAALDSHKNIQIVNDLTLMMAGQNSLLSAVFDASNTNIVHNIYGLYCSGLASVSLAFPLNGYVTENGLAFYVAEDGITFYVQES